MVTLMKRVTPQKSPDSQKTAFGGTVLFHGFQGILRAGGGKTAPRREGGGDFSLIEADERKKQAFHEDFSFRRPMWLARDRYDFRSLSYSAVTALERTTTTIS